MAKQAKCRLNCTPESKCSTCICQKCEDDTQPYSGKSDNSAMKAEQ